MGKLVWHQLVLFSVLALLTGLRLLTKNVALDTALAWWWLGGVAGFLFVFADQFVHAFMSRPDETLALRLKELVGKGKITTGLAAALAERERQAKPMIRSALFLVVWVVLAILTVTSVANSFSRGFMLGLSTHLVFDLAWDVFTDKRSIESWFWQIRNVSQTEKMVFIYSIFGFYALIVWFL